jgi:FkbM family methyltransferase
MLNFVKSPIQAVLSKVGLSVRRVKHEPYQELWEVPRFTEHTVTLLDRPFKIADSRSFFFSYREIFVDQIYRFNTCSPSPRIIDCGSNYGTSIIYFKSIYPNARITGIEADPRIFSLLAANCAHLDIDLLNKAVSNNSEPLQFFSEGSDGGRAGHVLDQPKAVVRIDAVTLDDLIDGHVDFLKIDIEGAEGDSLEACTKLSSVDQMFIEYHSFADSKQTLARMLEKLSIEGFRYYIHHQFCSPRPLTEEMLQLGMDLQLNIFAKRPKPTDRPGSGGL